MNKVDVLKQEFGYYIQHKKDFIEKYNEKFIVLQSHNVIYVSNTREEAINGALKKGYELGTFLVQYVTTDNNETIHRYCSRVSC